jgi:hypothetical protein
MALNRPEGLSPCYMSLMSPDIDDSYIFAWTFRGTSSSDYQTKFTITIYNSSGVVVKTFTKTTREMFCSASEVGYAFSVGSTYSWTVVTYNKDASISDPSVRAYFHYDDCPASPSVVWTYIPKQGEVIKRDTYFAEFKSNLLSILSDYENVPSSLTTKVNNLFTGDVIPSKKDFDAFQSVIDYLISTLEGTTEVKSIDVYGLISDSLGISDLEKIRNCIDEILGVKPLPVGKLNITTNTPDMYSMGAVTATSDGKEDTTISLSWSVGSISNESGSFIFTEASTSRDIRYYNATFSYGPDAKYVSELYYRDSDITDGKSYTFDMNWDGLFEAENLNDAQYILKATVVDHRGNESKSVTKPVTFASNFKIPMGVDHYEVQYQKNALTATTHNVNGTWSNVSTSVTSKTTTHKVSGASGKFFYRVRAIDDTGLTTAWSYSGGVTFDPLKPPGPVKNLRVTQVGVTDATIDWDAVPTAEEYEVDRYRYNFYGDSAHEGKNFADQTTTILHDTTLAANSIYNFYVRAKNRAGASEWTAVNVHTDRPTHIIHYDSVHCHSWMDDGSSWYSNQGVNHTYAYQGVWGNAGNNRGSWYFDYEDMRSVLKGAEITNVRMSIERMHAGYSTTPGKPSFAMHDRTTEQWSKNHGGTPTVLGAKATGNVSFVSGERKWVDLPNSYAEWIRDGKATGIMLYTSDKKPYMKFETWAQLEITYKK